MKVEQDREDDEILEIENQKSTEVTKCDSCGANLVFSPEKQMLECGHCGNTVDLSNTNTASEQSIDKMFESNDAWTSETHVFRCNTCGAVQVLSKTEIAKNCAFCGTSNIVESSDLCGIKPNAVVPFKVSYNEAGEKAQKWARKKFFAPSKFKKTATAESISGIYNPVFTFDTDTISGYTGRLGKRYSKTRYVNGKPVTTSYIKYFNIRGTVAQFYDDVLVQASSNISQKNIDKISPFKTNSSMEYSKEYLSGFVASQYNKDGKSCWAEARKVIDIKIRSSILAQYSYDVVDSLSISTQCNNITYKYILLPIYVGHCKWRHKLYNFFLNGMTGKINGKAPLSAIKVGVLAVLIAAVIVGGAIAFMSFAG